MTLVRRSISDDGSDGAESGVGAIGDESISEFSFYTFTISGRPGNIIKIPLFSN
jgi:hypothetical protein